MTDCQRWRSRRDSYRPAGEPIDASRYGVEVVEEGPARRFIATHHYEGTWPAARLAVGLHRAGAGLVGVAVFAVAPQPASIRKHTGVEPAHGVVLSRFVLHDDVEANGETWFLRRAFAALRQAKPDVRAVLSYSDPVPRQNAAGAEVKPGHLGIIYRAFNGRHVGRSGSTAIVLDAQGRTVSARALSKIRLDESGSGYSYRQLLAAGAPPRRAREKGAAYVTRALRDGPFRRLRHPGNLAYVWALDPTAEPLLAPRVPLPGRVPQKST